MSCSNGTLALQALCRKFVTSFFSPAGGEEVKAANRLRGWLCRDCQLMSNAQ